MLWIEKATSASPAACTAPSRRDDREAEAARIDAGELGDVVGDACRRRSGARARRGSRRRSPAGRWRRVPASARSCRAARLARRCRAAKSGFRRRLVALDPLRRCLWSPQAGRRGRTDAGAERRRAPDRRGRGARATASARRRSEALLTALVAGGGSQAQFNIPELGGMGQWSRGGMVMVGDMFNNALKARVDALCTELAGLRRRPAGAFAPRRRRRRRRAARPASSCRARAGAAPGGRRSSAAPPRRARRTTCATPSSRRRGGWRSSWAGG